MLEITEDLKKEIRKMIVEDKKSNNQILEELVSRDKELEKIKNGLKKRKPIDDIAREEKIKPDEAREGEERLYKLIQTISSVYNKCMTTVKNKKQVIHANLPHNTNAELATSIMDCKKDEKQKNELEISDIISGYNRIKQENNSEDVYKFVKEHLERFLKLCNSSGYNSTRTLYIASMYYDLGEFTNFELTLNNIGKKIPDFVKKKYEQMTKQLNDLKQLIQESYENNLSEEEIIQKCKDKLNLKSDQEIDSKFIKNVLINLNDKNSSNDRVEENHITDFDREL